MSTSTGWSFDRNHHRIGGRGSARIEPKSVVESFSGSSSPINVLQFGQEESEITIEGTLLGQDVKAHT